MRNRQASRMTGLPVFPLSISGRLWYDEDMSVFRMIHGQNQEDKWMKKRIISLLLGGLLCLGAAGCGGAGNG